MAREKNLEMRKAILQLWNQGFRTPRAVAERLGVPTGKVRWYMWQMRREGLLPKKDTEGDLLDKSLTLLKGALFHISSTRIDIYASNPKLADSLARAENYVREAMELIQVYRRMKWVVNR
ncbi:hypothetical protein [Thermofilum pendens]|uniref:hypothetical protein n=1 Tax=Thermofilum pendens TaxID=2269 RepID=UPI00069A92A5|nr:hypothetical protein [Thermofilum pendens]